MIFTPGKIFLLLCATLFAINATNPNRLRSTFFWKLKYRNIKFLILSSAPFIGFFTSFRITANDSKSELFKLIKILYFIGLFTIDKEQFPLKKGGLGVVKTTECNCCLLCKKYPPKSPLDRGDAL